MPFFHTWYIDFSLANHLSAVSSFILTFVCFRSFIDLGWEYFSLIIEIRLWVFKTSNWGILEKIHWNRNPSIEHWKFGWNFKYSRTFIRLGLEESWWRQKMSDHYKTLCLFSLSLSFHLLFFNLFKFGVVKKKKSKT